ncbi:hypothetical protein HHI36_006700 [Cryptolaemus montrouzieri]|uniref:Uncharacterized protein n=1 Tax=Cryptolaemus montrouzieri TaxID=559131 RepID=A0ABD2NXW0_9CUCU
MYEIYIAIGVILIITGVLSSCYFGLCIKRNKYKKCHIERISDGLGTFFLGVFYIYSYSVLSVDLENLPTTLNFPDFEMTYLNVSGEDSMNPDIFTTESYLNISNTLTEQENPSTSEILKLKEYSTSTVPDFVGNTSNSNKIKEFTEVPLLDILKNDSYNFMNTISRKF